MHAKRVASRETPATRELYTLHRYGVCLGASKLCLILRHTSLSWLWRSFVFLLAIRHHFKKYSTQCLMCCCCFLSVSIFFLTERSVKETLQMLKRKCFFPQVNSQIYEQGWFSCDLLRNHAKKKHGVKISASIRRPLNWITPNQVIMLNLK